MDAADILRIRLHAQVISDSAAATPSAAVSRLLAMQAQDYASAAWAVGLRLPDATLSQVEEAIADRCIVRTWTMRGTLHFVLAEDVRWMLALLPPRALARAAAREGQLGLDSATFARSGGLLAGALAGGRRLTRAEVMTLLEANGIATDGQRGYHIVWRLAQEGLLVLGPMEDKQQTFVLLDEWIPPSARGSAPTAASMSREESLSRLAARYFTGHGPATLGDLTRWADLPKREAFVALESVAEELESADYDGERYWFDANAEEAATRERSRPETQPDTSAPIVHLLPGFDEYLIAYVDRRLQLGENFAAYGARVGRNGMLAPTVIIDGQAVGVWKRSVKARSVSVRVEPFRTLIAEEREGVSEAAARYGRFLGLTATFEWDGR